MESKILHNRGITLIALVVTIIVTLILAGVSIGVLTGENGLINNAADAKKQSAMAQEKEILEQASVLAMGKNKSGILDKDEFEIELKKLANVDVDGDSGGVINVQFTDTKNQYIVENGKVSEVKELHIKNYAELKEFAENVNDGNSFKEYIVYLDNDITVEDDEWTMIGHWGGRDDPSMVFEGIFEGSNHCINNVNISSGKKGLFYANGGTIRNLNVELNIVDAGGGIYGGICSENDKNLLNCNVNIVANIDSSTYSQNPSVGGIAGFNIGIINNCNVTGEIDSSGRHISVGGIVGRNSDIGKIISCENDASLSCAVLEGDPDLGGIVGENEGEVLECLNTGELTVSASRNCAGDYGGIVGGNSGLVDKCVNKGLILSTSYGYPTVGGICGRASASIVRNCYNIGDLSSSYETLGFFSGIVGCLQNNTEVKNCFTVGNVTINGDYLGDSAAFSSSDSTDSITNCYYNSETCSASEDYATARTISQMKDSSFVSTLGSAFAADTNNINNGYPVLSWENE